MLGRTGAPLHSRAPPSIHALHHTPLCRSSCSWITLYCCLMWTSSHSRTPLSTFTVMRTWRRSVMASTPRLPTVGVRRAVCGGGCGKRVVVVERGNSA